MEWKRGWYLIRCQQRNWRVTQKLINDLGVETCSPVMHERKLRKDRIDSFRLVESQAFPGYMFVNLDPLVIHTTAIKRIPGVMDFVQFGLKTIPVDDEVIEAINEAQLIMASEDTYLCVGSEKLLSQIVDIYKSEPASQRISKLLDFLSSQKKRGVRNVKKEC